MMPVNFCRFILFFFAVQQLIWAGCESDLLKLFDENPLGASTSLVISVNLTHDEPILHFEREEEGRFGGRLRVYKHSHEKWISKRRSILYDPLGDPRWFLEIAGPKVAALFGVQLNGEEMVFPDAVEFSARVRWVNSELQKMGKNPLAVNFYHQDKPNLKVYLDKIQFEASFPLAAPNGETLDNHFLHDMSFHSSSVFLPSKLFENLAEQLRVLSQFFAFMSESLPQADPSILKSFRFLMRLKMVEEFDYASAWLTNEIVTSHHAFRSDKTRVREPGFPEVHRDPMNTLTAFKYFLGNGNFFSRVMSFFEVFDLNYHKKDSLEYPHVEKLLSFYSKDQWSGYWLQFYMNNEKSFNESMLKAPTEEELKEYCRLMNENRKNLLALAESLETQRLAKIRSDRRWAWWHFIRRSFLGNAS